MSLHDSGRINAMAASIPYISLFCGCGGFDLGFSHKSFNCVGAYDLNRHSIDTFNRNLPNVAEIMDLSKPCRNDLPTVRVIISGSPCQGFSTAGNRNLRDPRNNLFLRSVDIAVSVKPEVFVSENVTGIVSGGFEGHFVQKAIAKLRRHGYSAHWTIIDCLKLGLPQKRRRFVLVAFKNKSLFSFPSLNGCQSSIDNSLQNIPSDAPNHDASSCIALGKRGEIARCISPGRKLCNVRRGDSSIHTWNIPHVFGRTTLKERRILEQFLRERRRSRKRLTGDADPVSIASMARWPFQVERHELDRLIKKNYLRKSHDDAFDLTHTYNGKYRRLSWGEVSPTVDTRFGDPSLFLHPDEDRSFTVREAARLQGFPDDFVFYGPLREQYVMVGNAVPPPLGNYVAEIVLSLLRKHA